MNYHQLLFILFISFSNCYAQSNADQLRIEIDKIIRFDTEIDLKKTPGFLIGVIDESQIYKYTYGRRSLTANEPCRFDEMYELGSCTKLYTSLLLQNLAKKGIVDFDKAINNYISEEYINPRLNHVTIDHLINHMSGFPKKPSGFGKWDRNSAQPYLIFSKSDLMKYYSDFVPDKNKPKYIYSHTNYALLEVVIEKVTGLAIEDAFQLYVVDQLNLMDTHFDLGENMSTMIAPGYDRALKLTEPWVFSSFKGSEGLKQSLNDAMTSLSFFIKYNKDNLNSNIKPGLNNQLKMYNGWHLKKVNKTSYIYVHTGQTSGHTAFMALMPDTDTAVVILSNSKYGTEDLGMQILRMINFNWNKKTNL